MAIYRYYINFNKAVPAFTEFFPEAGIQTTNVPVTDNEFFREGCSEIKILRKGNQYGNNVTVYDTLETWFFDDTEFATEIEIEIYRGTIGGGTLYFAGFFSVTDGTIDREKRVFKITPRMDDAYRSFMELRDVRYNMWGQTNDEDIILGVPEVIGAWTAASPGATYIDFNTFTVGGNNGILTSVIGSDGANAQARYVTLGTRADFDVVFIDVSAYNQTGAQHPNFDIVDAADASITVGGAVSVTGTGIITLRINATGNAFLLLYTEAVDTTNFTMTFTMDVSDGVQTSKGTVIMDFIDSFVTNALFMDITTNVVSTYFANDALPSDAPSSIVTFIGSNPNGNYVSENADNPLNEFIISETRYWVDADVNEIMVSFNELMNDLRNSFDVGWYIDADGDFRIEHVKYFVRLRDDSTAIDLTSAPFDKYKAETDAKELNMNKALLANREQFEWQQTGTVDDSEDFVGVDIIYDNLETIENVLRHELGRITTDIIYLIGSAADAAADGFTYLQCYLDAGDYIVQNEVGVLSGDNVRNNHFSWANLHDKYWTWRRMSENGDMNDGDTVVFDSAVKFLEQGNVRFGYQVTLDPYTEITTSQGTGQQAEVVRDLDTDFLAMLIQYNPYA